MPTNDEKLSQTFRGRAAWERSAVGVLVEESPGVWFNRSPYRAFMTGPPATATVWTITTLRLIPGEDFPGRLAALRAGVDVDFDVTSHEDVDEGTGERRWVIDLWARNHDQPWHPRGG